MFGKLIGCGAVCAVQMLAWADGEVAETPERGVSFTKPEFVSAEVGLTFTSRYLSYGLVDNRAPILTPAAEVGFYDWFSFTVESIFDVTRYGRPAGYTNRAWQYTELYPGAKIGHKFTPEDFAWLPTAVEWHIAYQYEFHPNSKEKGTPTPEGQGRDSQFWMVDVGLPDVWFEPTFYYERDVMRDSGTYLRFDVGHTIPLVESKKEGGDPVLALRPAVSQGWGDCHRVAGYLKHEDGRALHRAGLMDTFIKLELAWAVDEHLSLTGFAGYSDYVFDSHTREAARRYEATGRCRDSYNFIGGVSIKATF